MKMKSSRRKFLQAGLALPAAGLISSRSGAAFSQAPAEIVYRTLGKTGLKVSGVGYGLGNYPLSDVIARCIDLGINYFDTARHYGGGLSEKVLGNTIKGKRNKILISTKTGGATKEAIFKDIDASLQTIGTDHVDVYLMAARDTPERISEEAVEAMEILKKQGKIRFFGCSTHDPNNMVDHIIKCGLDVVQTTYSYVIGAPFRDAAIKKLHDAGIGVVAMKVVIGLTTAPKQISPEPEKWPPERLKEFGLKEAPNDFSLQPTLKAEETPVAAIRWVLRNPAIGTTVPHHESVEEVEMNIRAMTGSFSPADEKLLYVRSEQNRPLYCRMCYQCKDQCPKGIPVTDELRFLAYHDFGGSLEQARLSFMDLPRKIRNLRCSDCASCTIQCPNGVMVRERLIRAQELLA
jgi:aryl-alcohol dehydrogenase-like predicted oxidoreductase